MNDYGRETNARYVLYNTRIIPITSGVRRSAAALRDGPAQDAAAAERRWRGPRARPMETALRPAVSPTVVRADIYAPARTWTAARTPFVAGAPPFSFFYFFFFPLSDADSQLPSPHRARASSACILL